MSKNLSILIGAAVTGATLAFASLPSFAATSPAMNSNAINHTGFFIGAKANYAKADYGNALKSAVRMFSNSTSDQGGLGAQVLAGYQFNRYFALQGDYFYIPTNKYKAAGFANINEKTYAFDVVAKGILPVTQHFDLFAKLGAAYVKAKVSGTIFSPFTGGFSASASKAKVRPVYGVGASYYVNKNLSIDTSWTQIYGKDDGSSTPMINMIGVGLTGHFA